MPVSIQFKTIKAKKYNQAAVLAEVVKELEREGDIEVRMFEKTTKTWKKKPKFYKAIRRVGSLFYVAVGTDDEIYGYVNDGTRPHTIRPKRARALRFQSGYKAKTSIRTIGSHKGGAFGKTVFSKIVKHPGTKARRFAEEIQKRRKDPFYKNMQKAITKGLSRVQ